MQCCGIYEQVRMGIRPERKCMYNARADVFLEKECVYVRTDNLDADIR